MSLFSRTDKSILGQWWWTVDRGMLAAFLILAVLGVLLVATASPPVAERIGVGYYHFLQRHVIFLVPALGMLVGLSFFNHQQIRRLRHIGICRQYCCHDCRACNRNGNQRRAKMDTYFWLFTSAQ